MVKKITLLTEILLFLIIISLFPSCSKESKKISQEDQQLLDYYFAEDESNARGYSYFVIKDGELVLESSVGYANHENQIENDSNTVFKITSVSKQFSAMALMLLIQRNELAYETTLTEVFPSFPGYGKTINMRHLLTHQSGLISYYEFIDEGREKPISNQEIFEILKTKDSTYFKPGSKFEYNQTGYALIPLIVEKISGKNFATFMKYEVFDKLDMNNTSIYKTDSHRKNRAVGYTFKNDTTTIKDKSNTSEIIGSKGVLTSVSDYFKWDQALYTDILLPKKALEEAFYNWEDNLKTTTDGYGYGWYVNHKNNFKILSHYGLSTGFTTHVNRIPELGLTAGIFSNYEVNVRILIHKTNALTSVYSDYKIPMPIETLMKMHIDKTGIERGISVFNDNKDNDKYQYDSANLSLLGSAYYRMEEYEVAKVLYEKSVKEYPEDFGGYFGLGRFYKKEGEIDKAIKNYEKVIQLGANGSLTEFVKRELTSMKKQIGLE